jgi:diguanylate cyclase (GGDEF)-like protein/PAS domain S-box-containing protein
VSKKAIETLLLIEDNRGDARLLREMFREHGAATLVIHVESMAAAETHLAEHAVGVILLDLGLPDAQGLDAVRRAHAAAPHVPLVVLTGLDDESLAIRTMKEGAQDYLIKGQIETPGLLRALRYAVERKTMEDALFGEKERAEVTLNCIGDAVACTDTAGNVSFLNLSAERMTGWPLQESLGRPMTEVLRIMDSTSRDVISDPLGKGDGDCMDVHLVSNRILVRRDGFEIPIEGSIAPIHNREGVPTGAVTVFRDVGATREMALQMVHAAEHDFLTGLPNRMLFNDRVSQAIALTARRREKGAVLFLDLDGFKHINDSLGHPIGDKLLRSVARRLVDCVRSTDTVSRQGGDEFVVLLPEMELAAEAAITARRMLKAVAEPHSIGKHDLHITTSIGISVYPDDGANAETLIKNADTAMYQAKENGSHSYQFFKPAMNVRAVERQSIEEGLRRALERREFSLCYQPKVDLRTGEITGAEALLRWTHPVRGVVAPAQFIPVAEDCGLLVPIGRWVLRQACAQARAWQDAGLPLASIAVNISAMQFRDACFLEDTFSILDDTKLDPHCLEIELTESILMRHADSADCILRALRARGVELAVDDFGTGYSSLSYLRKFPINSLKIDQSFVRQIAGPAAETAIVAAVISMGRSLNLRVVAEGVEKQEELAFLQEHQCDEAQGYYFSLPLPPPQFARLLASGIPRTIRPHLPRVAGFMPAAQRAARATGSRLPVVAMPHAS